MSQGKPMWPVTDGITDSGQMGSPVNRQTDTTENITFLQLLTGDNDTPISHQWAFIQLLGC